MDDGIFKHLLDSETLLKIRADDIKDKKGQIEGYKKGLQLLKESLEAAEGELEASSSELSQVKYQQQTKSRQLELFTDKLEELKEEVKCTIAEKGSLHTKRDTERLEYRTKVAHYSSLFTEECGGLECYDEGVTAKMRCIEQDILTKQADSTELEAERERLRVKCSQYSIKELEDSRNDMLTKRRELPVVVQQPHANTIQQLEHNIAKFEREIKVMSGEVMRMRQHSGPQHPGPQPQHSRAPPQHPGVPHQDNRGPSVPQAPINLGFRSAHNQGPSAQFTEGRCVVPSISPYFTPSVVKACNPGHSMTPAPVSDDMYDDGIVDDDLLELCKATDMLN